MVVTLNSASQYVVSGCLLNVSSSSNKASLRTSWYYN